MTDTIRLGPLALTFNPDGDDPGVGTVTLTTDDWAAPTGPTVTRYEWEQAVRECG